VGGISAVAGVIPSDIPGDSKGALTPQVVGKALREENIHYPETSLICLENTHNRVGGTICSTQITKKIYQSTHQRNIQVHLDGARIFNATVALNLESFVLTKRF